MSNAEQIGERIGNYRLLEPLGSGGMAELFLAGVEGGAERKVALKVIHPHLEKTQRFVDMFLDEGRVVGRVDHANVVRVEASGVADGRHYIAMEYIDGTSLGSVMQSAERHAKHRGPIASPVAVRIMSKVLEGLHAAHQATDADGRCLEVVHRDVSPQNVLLGHDGSVKVIDFGIAKARGRIHQTRHGNVKGKVRYMAPEHCGGEGVDRRTDVYSAAIILWELLTLTPYFRSKDGIELIQEVRRPRFRSPARYNEDVSPALEAVLRRALEADPDRRYPTARAFHLALLDACPASREVGPAHLAAFVAAMPAGDAASADDLTVASGSARRIGGAGYTFHVAVPSRRHGPAGEASTMVIPGARARAYSPAYGPAFAARLPVPELSRPRANSAAALFALALMVVCFLAGATGVALGHAYVHHGGATEAAAWLAEAPPLDAPSGARRR